MSTKITILGAGGKMGIRTGDNLRAEGKYELRYVEVSPAGVARLAERNVQPSDLESAAPWGEVLILAVPDKLIGKVCATVIPLLKAGTIVIGLDPAAAYAGVLPDRTDLTYFVTHPCHPPVFNDENDTLPETDWFGGAPAKQDIVCALHQGPEEDYVVGEQIAKTMYQPVMKSHRITVEQMAILEPALAETTSITLINGIRQAFDRAVEMGVPEEAARAFLMGHIRTEIAILFGYTKFPFSDGARMAMEKAQPLIFKEDWLESVMSLPALKQSVADITDSAPQGKR